MQLLLCTILFALSTTARCKFCTCISYTGCILFAMRFKLCTVSGLQALFCLLYSDKCKIVFHAFTFGGYRGSCLNTRPLGRVNKLLPRDRQMLVHGNSHV